MSFTCVVVMGVSGSGKSYLGQILAERLAATFIEGDDLHPTANVEKLRAGRALNDSDREPWLRILHQQLLDAQTKQESVVLAASLLKQAYRDLVFDGIDNPRLIFLQASESCIHERMTQRDHFMPASLLASQLATLEKPAQAICIENDAEPQQLCDRMLAALESGRGRVQ